MGARIRLSGAIVCAAMHPAEQGDLYLSDQELYEKVVSGEWFASRTHLHKAGCDGTNCKGTIIGGSGAPLCGDGLWLVSGT